MPIHFSTISPERRALLITEGRPAHHIICVGKNAGYYGNEHHIVVLGDDFTAPHDSPSHMLYVKGETPRGLPIIDNQVAALIARHIHEILQDSDRMGGDNHPTAFHDLDRYIDEWNASSRTSRA